MSRVLERIQRAWFAAVHGPRFRRLGSKAFMQGPRRIDGASGMAIGDATFVQRGSWLYCQGIDGVAAQLTIGAGCAFGYNNHIVAVRDVTIGNSVLTANNVYISDSSHGYEDITRPIMSQPVQFKQSVSIGDGTWLGENVSVLGARVGRNCVIGANAVVTRDIPDYCVAVGIPARVIRHFDERLERWIEGPRAS